MDDKMVKYIVVCHESHRPFQLGVGMTTYTKYCNNLAEAKKYAAEMKGIHDESLYYEYYKVHITKVVKEL